MTSQTRWTAILAALALALGAGPAYGQSSMFGPNDANDDPAWWPILFGGAKARWTTFPVPIEMSTAVICNDGLDECTDNVSTANIQTTYNAGAKVWNDAFETNLDSVSGADEFIATCMSGENCNLPVVVIGRPDPDQIMNHRSDPSAPMDPDRVGFPLATQKNTVTVSGSAGGMNAYEINLKVPPDSADPPIQAMSTSSNTAMDIAKDLAEAINTAAGMIFGISAEAVGAEGGAWDVRISAADVETNFSVAKGGTGSASLTIQPVALSSIGINKQADPGARSCLFPAFTVDPATGAFASWASYEVAGDGSVTVTEVGSIDLASIVCSLFVEHTLEDYVPDPANIPDTWVPVTNAQGQLRVFGNGRNELFAEQVDLGAVLGQPSVSTLGVTISRGFFGGGILRLSEADVFVGADRGNTSVPTDRNWSTVTAVANSDCPMDKVAGNDVNGWTALMSERGVETPMKSVDTDSLERTLCYAGKQGTWDDTFDLENVVTHELGHLAGLDHPCARYDVTPCEARDSISQSSGVDQFDCRRSAERQDSMGNPAGDPRTQMSLTTMFWRAREGQNNKRTLEVEDIDSLVAAYSPGDPCPNGGGGGCHLGGGPRLHPHAGSPEYWLLGFAAVLAPLGGLLVWRRRRPATSRAGRALVVLFGLACGLAWSAPAEATTIEIVSTASLARTADGIAHVRVTGIEAGGLPNGLPATIYTLEIVDTIYGIQQTKLFVPGGQIGDQVVFIPGVPVFRVGDELVLFGEQTDDGRFVIRSLFQGTKRIVTDPASGKKAVLTGAEAPAGTRVTLDAEGRETDRRAVGAAELPARMDLAQYKEYLRRLAAER